MRKLRPGEEKGLTPNRTAHQWKKQDLELGGPWVLLCMCDVEKGDLSMDRSPGLNTINGRK